MDQTEESVERCSVVDLIVVAADLVVAEEEGVGVAAPDLRVPVAALALLLGTGGEILIATAAPTGRK